MPNLVAFEKEREKWLESPPLFPEFVLVCILRYSTIPAISWNIIHSPNRFTTTLELSESISFHANSLHYLQNPSDQFSVLGDSNMKQSKPMHWPYRLPLAAAKINNVLKGRATDYIADAETISQWRIRLLRHHSRDRVLLAFGCSKT